MLAQTKSWWLCIRKDIIKDINAYYLYKWNILYQLDKEAFIWGIRHLDILHGRRTGNDKVFCERKLIAHKENL